jgi:hypothetical protein
VQGLAPRTSHRLPVHRLAHQKRRWLRALRTLLRRELRKKAHQPELRKTHTPVRAGWQATRWQQRGRACPLVLCSSEQIHTWCRAKRKASAGWRRCWRAKRRGCPRSAAEVECCEGRGAGLSVKWCVVEGKTGLFVPMVTIGGAVLGDPKICFGVRNRERRLRTWSSSPSPWRPSSPPMAG